MTITGQQLADAAVAKRPLPKKGYPNLFEPQILYSEEDCQQFVKNSVKRAGGDFGGTKKRRYAGSNDILRNGCKTLHLIDKKRLGDIKRGCVVFIVTPGYNTKYEDNLGDASHIGIVTLAPEAEIMHSSQSRGGVYPSTFDNAWTHYAFLKEDVVTYQSSTGNTYGGQGGKIEVDDVYVPETIYVPETATGIERLHKVVLPADKSGGTVNFRKTTTMDGIIFAYIPDGTVLLAGDSFSANGKIWKMCKYKGMTGFIWAEFLQENPNLTLDDGYTPAAPAPTPTQGQPIPPQNTLSLDGKVALLESKVEFLLKEIGSKYYKENK